MTTQDHKIKWVGSPNFWAGRNGRVPISIVDHITAGLMPGCLNWLQNPNAKASSHYLVTKTGQILQLIKDEDTAWANGTVNTPCWALYDGSNPNRYTLSIEHEGLAGESLTEEQYQATLWLHRLLIERWRIPVTTDTIVGHYRIDSVNRPNCPGPAFPWQRLYTDLQGCKSTLPDGAAECKIDIKGQKFPGYTLGGNSRFHDADVTDVLRACNNSWEWDEKTLTVKVS